MLGAVLVMVLALTGAAQAGPPVKEEKKAIQSFVGDHDGGHVVSSAPAAQRSQGQPVRYLQCVRREPAEQ